MTNLKDRSFAAKFLQYVTLSMLSMAGLSLYILADTFFIAQGMGTNGIAALNLLLPAFALMNAMGLMFGMGAATRYKIRLAEGKRKDADRVFTDTFLMTALLSLLFAALGLFIPDKISVLLGGDADTIPYMVNYLRVLWLFSPLFMLNNLMVAVVRNDNRPGLAMGVMLTGTLINIVLDWVFIFPLGWGMVGAALATGIAPTVSLIILVVARLMKKNTYRFVRPHFAPREIVDVFKLGISSLVNELSNGVVGIAFNFILLGIAGNTGVAAYAVINNIALVVIAMINGVAQGAQPLMSASHGANDTKYCKKTYGAALVFGAVLAVVAYGILAGLADGVIGLFNSEANAELAAIAKTGIFIYFIGMLPASFTMISAMFFNSTERPGKAITLSLMRGMILLIPAALILSRLAGLIGVWCSAPVTELLTAIIAAALLLAALKKSKKANFVSQTADVSVLFTKFTVIAAGLESVPDAKVIRKTVFVDEQGASEEEFDEIDRVAYHALVKCGEKPVATGRVYEENGSWRIGRIAVLKEYRNSGFGKEVVDALEREAKSRGAETVKIFADPDAVGFYKKLGYREDVEAAKAVYRSAVPMKKVVSGR